MSLFAFAVILFLLCVAAALAVLLTFQHSKHQRVQQSLEASEQRYALAQQQYAALENRFRPVVNLDQEAKRIQMAIQALIAEHQGIATQNAALKQKFSVEYQNAVAAHNRLCAEVKSFEERLEDASFGLYQPHYGFDTSEAYKAQLDAVRQARKQLVRDNLAARMQIAWEVGGSKQQGEKMQKQLIKLMLRAFNGECDATLANVTWNNVAKMEERLRKSFDSINQLGTVVQVSLEVPYLELSLQEIRLAFEYAEKKRAEQEEQRRIKERMREEERAQRELQRAQEDTAAEERRYEKALAKAREEAGLAKGEALAAMNEEIAELQRQLADAHARHDRAVSMAQLTRCGYVYIISNIGSFGESVFKIGMTRRLDPMDRVWELGDASVPFDFDVHAMIYTEDAPTLERRLHDFLEQRRVNMVNVRKEFFKVTLDEVDSFIRRLGLTVELTKLAEAREYRETIAIREGGSATVQASAFDSLAK